MLLSLSDLDQQLHSMNVPEWAISHTAGSKWKWSDVGMPPVMHLTATATSHNTKQQPANADQLNINEASCTSGPLSTAETVAAEASSSSARDQAELANQKRHAQHQHSSVYAARGRHNCSPEPSSHMGSHKEGYPKPYHASSPPDRATWRTPNSRSPSPPHVTLASAAPHTNLRSVSPSVAQACITLPGFLPSVGMSETPDSYITHGSKCDAPFSPGIPMQQSQRQAQTAAVHKHQPAQTFEDNVWGHNEAPAMGHGLASVSHNSASMQPSAASIDQQLKQWHAAGAAEKDCSMAAPEDISVQSWMGKIALPKVGTSCVQHGTISATTVLVYV